MGSCYCEYESMPKFFREKYVVAKKDHKCCECGQKIKAGDEYQYVAGVWEDGLQSYKTCETCACLRESLNDVGCPYYGGLYEEYWEYLASTLSSMDLVRAQFSKIKEKRNEQRN